MSEPAAGLGWTHQPSRAPSDDIVRVLLNAAANTEVETEVGRRPLHWAARNGCAAGGADRAVRVGQGCHAVQLGSDSCAIASAVIAQLNELADARRLWDCGRDCGTTRALLPLPAPLTPQLRSRLAGTLRRRACF